MKLNVEPHASGDDIDRIVDALLDNPDQSADLKTLLKSKLNAPETVRVAHATTRVEPTDDDDVDDLWDNVPV